LPTSSLGLSVREAERDAQQPGHVDAQAKVAKDADTRALKTTGEAMGLRLKSKRRGAGRTLLIKYKTLDQR
jgi:hypothetical protein